MPPKPDSKKKSVGKKAPKKGSKDPVNDPIPPQESSITVTPNRKDDLKKENWYFVKNDSTPPQFSVKSDKEIPSKNTSEKKKPKSKDAMKSKILEELAKNNKKSVTSMKSQML